MLMSVEDQNRYPLLMWYLKRGLPSLPSRKPKVYQIWRKYVGRERPSDGPLGRWSNLNWGALPYVKVDRDEMMQCSADGPMTPRIVRWFGFTSPNPDSNLIIIAEDLASLGNTPNETVLEATLLHEMIHWTRLKAGQKDYGDEDGPNGPYAFEREAYGGVLHRTWNYCLPYELDPSGGMTYPFRQP